MHEEVKINSEVPLIDPYGSKTKETVKKELDSISVSRGEKRKYLKSFNKRCDCNKDILGEDGKTFREREKIKNRKKRKKSHSARMRNKV